MGIRAFGLVCALNCCVCDARVCRNWSLIIALSPDSWDGSRGGGGCVNSAHLIMEDNCPCPRCVCVSDVCKIETENRPHTPSKARVNELIN